MPILPSDYEHVVKEGAHLLLDASAIPPYQLHQLVSLAAQHGGHTIRNAGGLSSIDACQIATAGKQALTLEL